jgi:uncharacterized protein YndB with AHSA1/START domain
MSRNAHVYQIYIAASPEQVWAAITESGWTRRYFHTTSFVEPPQRGTKASPILSHPDWHEIQLAVSAATT